MMITDAGVSGESYMNFTTPTEFARRALYYIPQYGHFFCNEKYRITRSNLDWFLIAYIRSGTLYLESGSRKESAHSGELALIDCRTPHCYYCHEKTDFYWFHFCGASSADYAELLREQVGLVFPVQAEIREIFERVFSDVRKNQVEEHMVSAGIHQLLGKLAAPENAGDWYRPLLPAIDYIQIHCDDPISVDELADMCNMSTSYLIRCFRKHLGHTPHEYILARRLQHSKQLLLTTDLTVERIAESCGFNSASHFSRAFRSNNHMSPTEFRKMQF